MQFQAITIKSKEVDDFKRIREERNCTQNELFAEMLASLQACTSLMLANEQGASKIEALETKVGFLLDELRVYTELEKQYCKDGATIESLLEKMFLQGGQQVPACKDASTEHANASSELANVQGPNNGDTLQVQAPAETSNLLNDLRDHCSAMYLGITKSPKFIALAKILRDRRANKPDEDILQECVDYVHDSIPSK
jgi:hypothetical protein